MTGQFHVLANHVAYTLVAYTHNYVFLLICCYSPFWTGTSNPKLAPMPEANSTEHSIPLQLVQFSRSHAQTARDPTNQLGHISSCLVRGYWVTTNIMHVGVTTKAVAATHSHDTQRAIHFKQRRRKSQISTWNVGVLWTQLRYHGEGARGG